MVEAYQQIGIQVKVNGIDPETYFDVIGNPANTNDLMLGRLDPGLGQRLGDHPAAVRRPPDPGEGQRDQQPELLAAQRPGDQRPDRPRPWKSPVPDRQCPSGATSTSRSRAGPSPSRSSTMKALRMSGSNVRGGFIHPAFGQPDLCALGLA